MKRYKVSCLVDNQRLRLKTRGNTIELMANDPTEAAIEACKELQCQIVNVEEVITEPLYDRRGITAHIYNNFGTRMVRDKSKGHGYVRADGLPKHTSKSGKE